MRAFHGNEKAYSDPFFPPIKTGDKERMGEVGTAHFYVRKILNSSDTILLGGGEIVGKTIRFPSKHKIVGIFPSTEFCFLLQVHQCLPICFHAPKPSTWAPQKTWQRRRWESCPPSTTRPLSGEPEWQAEGQKLSEVTSQHQQVGIKTVWPK